MAGKIGGALWLPFLLAFVVAFLTAFSYLELVGKYPQAAGAALYTHKAFGINFLTFMVTFTVMASGVTSAATAAKAFGDTYLKQFIELPTWAVAGAFILGLALINFRGVGESVKANVVLTIIELSGPAADHRGRGLRGGAGTRRAEPPRRDQHRRDAARSSPSPRRPRWPSSRWSGSRTR